MPTYEYRCPEGHEFEVFQKMSDDPGRACPECGADAARVISGGAGLRLGGGGPKGEPPHAPRDTTFGG